MISHIQKGNPKSSEKKRISDKFFNPPDSQEFRNKTFKERLEEYQQNLQHKKDEIQFVRPLSAYPHTTHLQNYKRMSQKLLPQLQQENDIYDINHIKQQRYMQGNSHINNAQQSIEDFDQQQQILQFNQRQKQPFIINIEVCVNCSEHLNQHIGEKEYFFQKLYNQCIENIKKVMTNVQIVQNYNIPIPKIGAFEIRHENNIIWSRILFDEFPDPDNIGQRTYNYYQDFLQGNDLLKYSYKNSIRSIQQVSFYPKTTKNFTHNNGLNSQGNFKNDIYLNNKVLRKNHFYKGNNGKSAKQFHAKHRLNYDSSQSSASKQKLSQIHQNQQKSLVLDHNKQFQKQAYGSKSVSQNEIPTNFNNTLHSQTQISQSQLNLSNINESIINNMKQTQTNMPETIIDTKDVQSPYNNPLNIQIKDQVEQSLSHRIESLEREQQDRSNSSKQRNKLQDQQQEELKIQVNTPSHVKNMNSTNRSQRQEYNEIKLQQNEQYTNEQGHNVLQQPEQYQQQQYDSYQSSLQQTKLQVKFTDNSPQGNNLDQKYVNQQQKQQSPTSNSPKFEDVQNFILQQKDGNSVLDQEQLDNYYQILVQNLSKFWEKYKVYYNSFQYNPSFKRVSWEMYDIFAFIKQSVKTLQINMEYINDQLQIERSEKQQISQQLGLTEQKLLQFQENTQQLDIRLKEQERQKDEEIKSLKNQLEEKIQELNSQNKDYKGKLMDVSRDLENTNMELSNQQIKSQKMENQILGHKESITQLNTQVIAQKFAMAHKKSVSLGIEQQNQILQQRIEQLEKEVKELEHQASQGNKQIKQLKFQKENTEKSAEQLKEEKIYQENEKSQLQKQLLTIENDKNTQIEGLKQEILQQQGFINSVFQPQKSFPKASKISVKCYMRTYDQTKEITKKKKTYTQKELLEQAKLKNQFTALTLDFNCVLINNLGDVDQVINSQNRSSEDQSIQYIQNYLNEEQTININFTKISETIKVIAFIITAPKQSLKQILSGYLQFQNKGYICKYVELPYKDEGRQQLIQFIVKQTEQWSILDVYQVLDNLDPYEMIQKTLIKSGAQFSENCKRIAEFKPDSDSIIRTRLIQNEELPLPNLCYKKFCLVLSWKTKSTLDLDLCILAMNKYNEIVDLVSPKKNTTSDQAIVHYGQQTTNNFRNEFEVYQEEVYIKLNDLDQDIKSLWVYILINQRDRTFIEVEQAFLKFMADKVEFSRFDFTNVRDKESNGCLLCQISRYGNRWALKSRGYFTQNVKKLEDAQPIIQQILNNNLNNVKVNKTLFKK